MNKYYSNGKLLLTGEYVVLDGALALAVPTKYGQSLTVNPIIEKHIKWTSLDYNNEIWYSNEFIIEKTYISSLNKDQTSQMLLSVFNAIQDLNPSFFEIDNGYEITTTLNFPTNWGLGSSSTLINNIANWVKIDAYKLLELTFGGSGYDIACASHDTPISYQIKADKNSIKEIDFNPPFSNNLFFIHRNKKQNSREGISHYNLNKRGVLGKITAISEITKKIISCSSLSSFESLVNKHEELISTITNLPTVKSQLFSDYKFGAIKSLGAWGGDFILASGKASSMNYFRDKGYKTIIAYNDMVL